MTENSREEGSVNATGEPVLSGPKRQHFLPSFYLHNFARDGFVAVYDRAHDEVRRQQPKNTGVITHFYTLEDSDGRRRFEIEQLFAEYEGKAKAVIDKLSDQSSITADERSDLAIFLAFGAMRTPEMTDSLKALNSRLVADVTRRIFSDVDEIVEMLKKDPDSADKTSADLEGEATAMMTMATEEQFEIVTDHGWAVSMAVRMALEIAPIFAGRNWRVLHVQNEKISYVTSDSPFLLGTVGPRPSSFWGVGFGNADALTIFPLTQDCALAISGQEGKMVHASVGRDQVRDLNLRIASQCQRFLIGRDEALVRSLAKATGLASNKWSPRMQPS